MPYRSDENKSIAEKGKKILLLYHHNKITKTEFNRRMAILYNEPMHLEKFFEKKKEER